MALKQIGTIEIPGSKGSSFDHGAFDARTRRVFVAHTGRSCIEVIDHDGGKHVATLAGFPEAAGVVADEGQVLVTNRGCGEPVMGRCQEPRHTGGIRHRPPGPMALPSLPGESWRLRPASGMTRIALSFASLVWTTTGSIRWHCRDNRAGA